MNHQVWKIMLTGHGGASKTSWARALQGQTFTADYTRTCGLEYYAFWVQTSHGDFQLFLWDVGCQSNLLGLEPACRIVDANLHFAGCYAEKEAVYMTQLKDCLQFAQKLEHSIPRAMIQTKIDLPYSNTEQLMAVAEQNEMDFHQISVKEQTNLMEPLRKMLERLMKSPGLKILSFEPWNPKIHPPKPKKPKKVKKLTPRQKQQLKRQKTLQLRRQKQLRRQRYKRRQNQTLRQR